MHGKLTDTLNNPYSGSKNFIFRIYSAQSGGSPLYTEFWNASSQQVTLATGGYFSVLLGSQTALTLPFDQQYWLELSVEGETLSPRYKLGSTPYTYRANITENLAANANASGTLNMNSQNITNVNYLGIGTATPLSKLHINQSGSNTLLNATNGTVNAGLYAGTLSGGNAGASIGTNSNHVFNIFTNGQDRVTVDTNGNVGIGTTAPGDKLVVNVVSVGATNTRLITLGSAGAAQDASLGLVNDRGVSRIDLTFNTQYSTWSEKMRITNEGNVGIGTTGPRYKFDVNGRAIFGGSANAYTFISDGGTSDTGPFVIWSNDSSGSKQVSIGTAQPGTAGITDAMIFSTFTGSAWGERMRLTNSGNVGIGTTGPAVKLDVNGDIRATGSYSGTSGSGASMSYINGAGHFFAYNATAPGYLPVGVGASDSLYILTNGNVGIGTTGPNTKLDIKGTGAGTQKVNIQDTAGGSFGFDLQGAGVTSRAALYVGVGVTADTEAISIPTYGTTKGYVGIGRTPTTYKLEVEGDASKTTAGSWQANSDRRIKTDINNITNATAALDLLRPVMFKYTDEYKAQHPSIRDKYYYNFIAQEFQKVFPSEVTVTNDTLPNGEHILAIDPYVLTPYLVKAVQELKADNDALNALVCGDHPDAEACRK